MTENKTALPYLAKMDVLLKIPLALNSSEMISIGELWKRLTMADKPDGYSLRMAEYLGLITIKEGLVSLTKHGDVVAYLYREKNVTKMNEQLIMSLPKAYLDFIRWISLSPGSKIARADFDLHFKKNSATQSTDRMNKEFISTFLEYCERIGAIEYTGRGGEASILLTSEGKLALSGAQASGTSSKQDMEQGMPSERNDGAEQKGAGNRIPIDTEDYDVVLLMKGLKPFRMDIRTPAEVVAWLKHVDAVTNRWAEMNKIVLPKKQEEKHE